jgi:hypothetical protein
MDRGMNTSSKIEGPESLFIQGFLRALYKDNVDTVLEEHIVPFNRV